jgi:hypothetical protein
MQSVRTAAPDHQIHHEEDANSVDEIDMKNNSS